MGGFWKSPSLWVRFLQQTPSIRAQLRFEQSKFEHLMVFSTAAVMPRDEVNVTNVYL